VIRLGLRNPRKKERKQFENKSVRTKESIEDDCAGVQHWVILVAPRRVRKMNSSIEVGTSEVRVLTVGLHPGTGFPVLFFSKIRIEPPKGGKRKREKREKRGEREREREEAGEIG